MLSTGETSSRKSTKGKKGKPNFSCFTLLMNTPISIYYACKLISAPLIKRPPRISARPGSSKFK